MKSIGKLLIIPIIIGIVITTYTYYINLQKVDLRYTLSEKIPLNISGSTSPEAIQQLEVKNIGNNQAEKIIININGVIKTHEISKYSESDKYEVYLKQNSFEIVYPALPPQGSIKVIIKSEGNGIRKEDLTVKHNKGSAVEALSKQTSLSSWIYMLLLYGILITMMVWGFRDIRVSSLERKAKYPDDVDDLLKRKKPFYLNEERWQIIRKQAIDTKATDKGISGYNLEQSLSYKTLSSSKPEYINNDEWGLIVEKLNKSLSERMEITVSEATYPDRIILLLKVNKPINFLDQNWIKITNEAYEKYLSVKKYRVYSLLTIDSCIQAFKEDKPIEIPEKYWVNYTSSLKEVYYRLIERELRVAQQPIQYLNAQVLEYLDFQEGDRLKSYAYSLEFNKYRDVFKLDKAKSVINGEKPSWVKEQDYKEVISDAKQIIDIENRKECFTKKLALIDEMISKNVLTKDKPEFLSNEEWGILSKAYSEISSVKSKIKENKEKEQENFQKETVLSEEKRELLQLKEKVIKQLNIINQVLSEPDSIERIEDYENAFAPGNFRNLQKIASILRENKS